MKVLLCGEGAHDIGLVGRWSIDSKKQVEEPGWLQPLLAKIFGEAIEFVIVPRSRLVSLPRAAKPPLPKGHGTKALIAKYRAHTDKCDLVVFMLDADTTDPKVWKSKRDEVLAGFAAFASEVKAVACIPMSASESWLLSDEAAWNSLGLDSGNVLPKRPELAWGVRNDPLSDHPHRLFARVCEKANLADCRETRVELMSRATINIIKEKCPNSFGAFLEDLAA